MAETGQPAMAPENVAIADATASFKAFLTSEKAPERPRDDQGRFAPVQASDDETPAADDEGAYENAPEAEAADGEPEGEPLEQEADEAQPEPDVPLPVSWAKEDEALWNALPADAKAKIFAREAQREQAINLKFQEAANTRRAAEQQAQEAANSRNAYIQQLQAIEASVMPQRPDPAMLNPQSPAYDPDSYHLMRAQYEQASEYLNAVRTQRTQAEAEARAQQEAADREWRASFEAQWQPKLLAAVPELADPTKQPVVLAELTQYALANGYDDAQLQAATSADILTLWKAAQFDKQRQAAQRVQATAKPQPKPAAPAIRPGVTQPASLVRQSAFDKQAARLRETGSIEDGAAMFKLMMKRK